MIMLSVSGSKPKVQPKDFFFFPCNATIELHPDLSLLQRQGEKCQGKNSNHLLHLRWPSTGFGIQKVESCIMNEWVSNGNWERWHSTPGFSHRGLGGGRVEPHILLHPGVPRKESCKCNVASPPLYPTYAGGKKSI